MRPCGGQLAWELEGRLPVLYGHSQTQIAQKEISAVRAAVDEHGLLLFRDFDLSGEAFVRWTEQLSGTHGFTRMAPGASSSSGPRIGLHTEDAMFRPCGIERREHLRRKALFGERAGSSMEPEQTDDKKIISGRA